MRKERRGGVLEVTKWEGTGEKGVEEREGHCEGLRRGENNGGKKEGRGGEEEQRGGAVGEGEKGEGRRRKRKEERRK